MTDVHDARAGVESYEQLRRHALDGDPSGFRLGLAVLERRGVAASTRAWRGATLERERQQASAAAPVVELPAGSGGELVGALASMALARVAAG